MAAYVIVDSEITDQAVFDGYIRDIPAVVEKRGQLPGPRRPYGSGIRQLDRCKNG